jgi:pyridoxal phosphate enzyme (YggS family)
MPVNDQQYDNIKAALGSRAVLVAVSKTKPAEDIRALYELGQRDFGENYVQELVDKQAVLPADIRWHFIGHLQSNKVKYILPFVHLIHGVDSLKLLKEINKQAAKLDKKVRVLLQVHIAREETKFGMDEAELEAAMREAAGLAHICVGGLMGMASFSSDAGEVRKEFRYLRSLFDKYGKEATGSCTWDTLSMGMSGDYTIAMEAGSTMVRIGSLLFGERSYP